MHRRDLSILRSTIFLTVLLLPGAASAQSTPTLGQDWTAGRAAAAEGKTVRVTKSDGTRISGKLVSISSADVVVQRKGSDVTVPLAQVRRVEKVGRAVWKGLHIGGLAAFLFGFWVAEDDYGEVKAGAQLGALGAAGGAYLGALIDRASRNRNLIYFAKSRSASAVLLPLVRPRQVAVQFKLVW